MRAVPSGRGSVVTTLLLAALVLGCRGDLPAQLPSGSLVMGVKQEPTAPIPYFGPPTTGNADVADQLFLRLTALGPTARTTGDDAMVPELASSWKRIDATTVDFTIDLRARWHDGVPVTAHDVVFAWDLLHTPGIGYNLAPFALIKSVTARSSSLLRVTFTEPSSEQVYTAGFLLQPLPLHLLSTIPAREIGASDFARTPVGNGPYRFERRTPARSLELRANPTFFLGTPGIERLIFLVVPSTDAQVNMLLAGQLDVLSGVPSTASEQIRKAGTFFRMVSAPGNFIAYALFNARDPNNPANPHPLFSDSLVRRALALATNRRALAEQAYGAGVQTPEALRSQAWFWLATPRNAGLPDIPRARNLLRSAGWADHDGDGVLDRRGQPLRFSVIYPSQASSFSAFAVQLQQMWKVIGVELTLEPLIGSVWLDRRNSGRFDLDIAGVNQDPSPSSLSQSWSCASASQSGSSNVGRWCDPTFDQLLTTAPTQKNPVTAFRAALERMGAWQPAIVLAAPINLVAVQSRFDNVIIKPSKSWTSLWQWRIRSDARPSRSR